jgi:hypothetical protein
MWTLNRSSKFVRWTYFLNTGHRPPQQTSLCAIFWRGCVLMPLLAALCIAGAGAILFLLVKVGIFSWHHLRAVLFGLAGALSTVTILVVGSYYALPKKVMNAVDSTIEKFSKSVVVGGFKAVKSKFCPIIWIS